MSDFTWSVDALSSRATATVSTHTWPGTLASGGGASEGPLAATAQVTGTMAVHSTMNTASLTSARSSRRRAKTTLTEKRAA